MISTLYARYQELQSYVGWSDDDVRRVLVIRPHVESALPALIEDFYHEIERHPDALKVITGGRAQIERLKGTLRQWVEDLLGGRYDRDYVERRWRVGWRHVEIKLDQVFTNVALSRLRSGLIRALHESWNGDASELWLTICSLNKLLDLDLAIIEDAYQVEFRNRLLRTERLATLGQIAGGVAHELRNPLNVVKTSVYYLRHARNPSDEKKQEHLSRIERHVEIADSVITALSNFAKMPVPNMRPVPVDSLLRETLEVNPPGDHIQVEVHCPAELPPVLADSDQLRIVFGNLIRNARDAMPHGGRLMITGRSADGQVEIDVADDGVGISEEDLKRVMEPLYSTKARGLGLGLAIARSILEKNQAELRVTSSLGQGSTFTVRLAASHDDGATR